MKVPVIRGVIDRRILVNYRVDPDLLAHILPSPFRPKLVHGVGIAGICLIRLQQIRPQFLPAAFGVSSENAAHRIAVEWEEQDHTYEGVYIPRRDTSSRVNNLVGGRLFPGLYHAAHFHVSDQNDYLRVMMASDDDRTHLRVEGRLASHLPPTSVFGSMSEASDFFERGSVGYSATLRQGEFDGLELRSFKWQMQPLAVEKVESSFFEDQNLFPAATAQFDSALLMRGIDHEWHAREPLCIKDVN
jgi:hypothetical protein